MERSREYLLDLISKGDKSALVDIVDTMFSKREDIKKVKVTEKKTVSSVASITGSVFWESILSKPSEFPPTHHEHQISDVIGLSEILGSYTHNGFSDLQGGIAGEYFHLSYAQYATVSSLTGWATKAYTNGSTTDVAEGTNLYFTDARADARITLQKGAVNGIASLGSDGKVPLSQLPATTIVDTFITASQTAMLALVAQQGDVCVRTDLSKTFILKAEPASTLANWQEMLSPSDGVQSVAMTVSGPLAVSGSPITSTGMLGLTWSGSSSNLVRADGSVVASSTFASSSHDHAHMNVGNLLSGGVDPFASRGSYDARGGVRTANGAGPFGSIWYNMVDVRHRNAWTAGDIWGGELVWGMTSNQTRMAFRSRAADGTPTSWTEVWTASNLAVTAFAKTILDDTDAASVRATIGAQAAGSYQPLEDQRLSTTNSVTFNNLTSTLGATLGGCLVTPYGRFRDYTGSASYQGFYPSGVEPNNNNFSILWHSSNAQTYLNATSSIYLQIFDGTNRNTRLQVQDSLVTSLANFAVSGGSLRVGTTSALGYGGSIDVTGSAWTSIVAHTSSTANGAGLYCVSPTNSGAGWFIHKRDDSSYSVPTGSLTIEDSSAGNVSTRFALFIAPGSSGGLTIRRPTTISELASATVRPLVASITGLIQAQDAATFRSTIGIPSQADGRIPFWASSALTSTSDFTISSLGLYVYRNILSISSATATDDYVRIYLGAKTSQWNIGNGYDSYGSGTFTIDNGSNGQILSAVHGSTGAISIGGPNSRVTTFTGVIDPRKQIDFATNWSNTSVRDNLTFKVGSMHWCNDSGGNIVGQAWRGSSTYTTNAPTIELTAGSGYLAHGVTSSTNGTPTGVCLSWDSTGITSLKQPVTEVSGTSLSLPTGAATGTHLYYTGRTSAATDTITIPSGESVWYRDSAGATSLLSGPTTLNVNRRFVHLVKCVNEWRIVGLYN